LLSKKLTNDDLPERIFVLLNYQFFKPQDFTFQSIRETGDFRLLRDIEFKRNLLKLRNYQAQIQEGQKNFQQALDYSIVPMIMENFDMAHQEVVTTDFINDHRFLNIVDYTINDLGNRITMCKITLNFIEKLTTK